MTGRQFADVKRDLWTEFQNVSPEFVSKIIAHCQREVRRISGADVPPADTEILDIERDVEEEYSSMSEDSLDDDENGDI